MNNIYLLKILSTHKLVDKTLYDFTSLFGKVIQYTYFLIKLLLIR